MYAEDLFSKKQVLTETKYDIYYKELIALVRAFEEKREER